MQIGNRVLLRRRCVAKSLVEEFGGVPLANISDSMGRLFAGGANIRPMHNSGTMAGVAITVRSRPGDNLMLHKAVNMAKPGDVIVVDASGDLTNAMLGDLMLTYAKKLGVAGFVVNGAVRDVDLLKEINLPVYAAGITHRGPYKTGPGEINVPITIGGMIIEPGDVVVGDNDGFLCIPYDLASEVLKLAKAKQKAEENQLKKIEAGENDRSWVDKALAAINCEIEEA
jgi:RraA family protein